MYRKFIISLLLIGSTVSASAGTLDFNCITKNRLSDCAIGENQLSVEFAAAQPGEVAFTFRNAGAGTSSVSAVYFDDGPLLGISRLIDADQGVGGHPGVDFTSGSASPPNLPGGNSITPRFVVTAGFLARADNPAPRWGINPGEWLTIVFNLVGNQTVDDVADYLADGRLRIGMHVTGFASGGSESFVNNPLTPVPVPAAAWLFLSALMGSGLLYRRREKSSR